MFYNARIEEIDIKDIVLDDIIKLKKENRKLVKIITKKNIDEYLLNLMNVEDNNQTKIIVNR
mgnify:CR=1 FL=1